MVNEDVNEDAQPSGRDPTPEWLTVLAEVQLPTPADVGRLTRWAEPHDEMALRETAYALVEKWPGCKKKKSQTFFGTFQSWVRVAERSPPRGVSRPMKNHTVEESEQIRTDKERWDEGRRIRLEREAEFQS